jgi:hypothetical protein
LLENDQAGLSRASTESLLSKAAELAPISIKGDAVGTRATAALQGGDDLGPSLFSTARWELGAVYAVQPLFDYSSFVHGPGLFVTWALGTKPTFGLWAEAQYQFEDTWRRELAGVRLQTNAFRFGGEVRPRLVDFDGGHVSLAFRLGAGPDLIRISPSTGVDTEGLLLTSERSLVNWVVTTAIEPSARLSSWFALKTALFFDFVPGAAHYDVLLGDSRQVVFEPLLVRPGLMIGATFTP